MATNPVVLFSTQGTLALPNHPALNGGCCAKCGSVFFPMQTYGCERCGSQQLEARTLSGRGKLICSARVHMSADQLRPAPFVVGSIKLDDGAVVRSVLAVEPDFKLAPGTVMITILVPETRPDRGEFDLRFTPAAKEA
jgi:uncharacterized OB-fold protein